MNLLKWILLILSTLLILAAGIAWYLGFFYKVEVLQKQTGPFLIVYEKHSGDYRKIHEVINALNIRLEDQGIHSQTSFGLFFDNPQNTPADSCKSWGGFIISESDFAKIPLLDSNYNVSTIEKQKFVYAEFPFRSPLSIFAAILKVYPEINKYQVINGIKPSPTFEIYNKPERKIQYLVSITG